MFKKKGFWGAILGLMIILLLVFNILNTNSGVYVTTTEVTEGMITEQVFSSGKLEAGSSSDLYAPIGGVVEEVLIKEGDTVEKGQIVMKMKVSDIQDQIDRERVNIEMVKAERLAAEKQHFEAFKKSRMEDPSAEPEELDLTTFDLRIRSSELVIESLEKKLANSEVKATEGGVIADVLVDPGQMVAEGGKIANVVDMSSFKVTSMLNEIDAAKVSVGMMAIVSGESIAETYEGEVTYMSPVAVLTDQNSKDASVEVTVELNRTTPELRPGYNVSLEFTIPDKERLLVPMAAVKYEGTDAFVFVVKDETAIKTKVTTGKESEEYIELVDGVTKGDVVVLEGADQLVDGEKVKIK